VDKVVKYKFFLLFSLPPPPQDIVRFITFTTNSFLANTFHTGDIAVNDPKTQGGWRSIYFVILKGLCLLSCILKLFQSGHVVFVIRKSRSYLKKLTLQRGKDKICIFVFNF
jgi:hypothetical protein